MSIEPASVSNPVMRDNENGSLRKAGNGTQGSATGRKEGQFGSFWDKAVYGAQKLFGIERPSTDGIEERDSDEESKERSESRPDSNLAPRSGRPIAWSQGRSGLTNPSGGDLSSRIPEFGSTRRIPEHRDESSAASRPIEDGAKAEQMNPKREKEALDSVEDGESEDSEAKEAKSADRVVPVLPSSAQRVPDKVEKNSLSTDKKQDTVIKNQVGINSAKQAESKSTMTSLPTVQLPKDNASSDSSLVEVVNSKAEKTLPTAMPLGEVSGPRLAANRPVDSNVVGESSKALSPTKLAETPTKLADTSRQAITAEGLSELDKQAAAGKTDRGLAIDPDKAKTELSKALENAQGNRAQLNRDSKPIVAKAPHGETAEPNKAATESFKSEVESKLPETTTKATPIKSSVAPIKAADVAKAVANTNAAVQSPSNESSNQEATVSKKSDAASVPDLNREFRGLELRSVDTRPNANRARPNPTTVGAAVAGLQANAVASVKSGMGAENQSQGNGGSGKSDKPSFEMSATRDTASKANASSAKSEGTQGFQVSSSQSSTSSKTAFAAKAQPTSYASKGAEEVKEIYATLSRSIERLSNAKGETISIRINFDQGGSMALRVSMDGGQVNTTMQTDLSGLESLIKSNWSELASDWNAKGVKLNAPQFTQGNADGNRDDAAMNFKQGESQSQNGSSNDSKAKGGGRVATDSPAANSSTGSSETTAEVDSHSETGEQELLTYA